MAKAKTGVRSVVKIQFYGTPKLRIGAWLIRLGAHLARVHVKIWIEEDVGIK